MAYTHTKTGRTEIRTRTAGAVPQDLADALGRPAQEHIIEEIWEEVYSTDHSGWERGPSTLAPGWRRVSQRRIL